MLKFLKTLSFDTRGVSAVEYAVLAGILLVIIVAGVTALGGNIEGLFGRAGALLDGVLE